MWRRTYLLLLLVRIYFAVSPSYLHPDENFQGPEVIAGMWEDSLSRENRDLWCLFADHTFQGTCSHTQATERGNGPAPIQSEASSLCGQCMAFP